jgi:hypothetical protein
MAWQEYQDAVADLYERLERLGVVSRNVFIPDKITGQKRQIDVWCVIEFQNHNVKILIDAKSRKTKIDVKDVEEVRALAESVNADKAIIVTNEGWTKPAKKKADFCSLDLRLLSFNEATEILERDRWVWCPECNEDFILMDGAFGLETNQITTICLCGKCRKCKALRIDCGGCGRILSIKKDMRDECVCKTIWKNEVHDFLVSPFGIDAFTSINEI